MYARQLAQLEPVLHGSATFTDAAGSGLAAGCWLVGSLVLATTTGVALAA
jgi:hypothetical protein